MTVALGALIYWRRTWHDLAADTIVIRGSPARAAPPKPLPRRRSGDRTYRLG